MNEVRKGYLMGEKLLRAARWLFHPVRLRKGRVAMAEKRDYYEVLGVSITSPEEIKSVSKGSDEVSP